MIPRNVLPMSALLIEAMQDHAAGFNYFNSLKRQGWTFYVVDQKRGYCRSTDKTITIPAWLWSQESMRSQLGDTMCLQTKQNYRVWYICHEMAHAMDWLRTGTMSHNPSFMQCLKEICPPEAIGYESGYQTKTALACGIAPDDF